MSSKSNPQLCAICNSFLSAVKRVGNPPFTLDSSSGQWVMQILPESEAEVLQHYPTFHEFEQSATSGCHMCALFMLELSERDRILMRMHSTEEGKGQGLIAIKRDAVVKRAMYEVLLRYPMPEHMASTRISDQPFLKLYLRPTEATSCESRPFHPNLTDLPLSSWENVLSWVSNCIENHQECKQEIFVGRQLPSRVIDVGEADDYSDVRLCNREEIGTEFHYATLSHCWGPNGLSFKLLKLNLSKFLTRIPWWQMPQTFKDAIIATRKLRAGFGIKYVWIDALCIIQECEEDWTREAKVMGDYYRNSFCNFTACVGPDANSGLFHRRDPFSLHTCVVKIDHPSTTQGLFTLENEGSLGSAVTSSVLSSRGWVVQEFHLAPRLLHFTPQELFWQCATLYARERQPVEMIPGLVTRAKRDTFDGPEILQYENGSAEYDYQVYRVWMNVVRDYTGRQLTVKSDKLVAISGIAKRMQQSLGGRDTYVCGLWKRHLALHLLWSVSLGPQKQRPMPYIAPSWSWASIEGGVYNHRTNQEAVEHTVPLITFEDPKVEYYYNDPFSSIKLATIRVTGHMLKAELGKRGGHEANLAHLYWCGGQITTRPVTLDLSMPGANSLPVYCLVVVLEKNEGAKEYLVGLLLHRAEGLPGRYERYGIFQLDIWSSQNYQKNAKASNFSKNEYEIAHEDGQVTFTII